MSDFCTAKIGRDETHSDTHQSLLALLTCVPHHGNVLRARCASACHVAGAMGILTTCGVEVPTTAARTRLHENALDAGIIKNHQQFSDMQLDVGQNIVPLSCVECCAKLLEFAHTSGCVCLVLLPCK